MVNMSQTRYLFFGELDDMEEIAKHNPEKVFDILKIRWHYSVYIYIYIWKYGEYFHVYIDHEYGYI